MKKNLLIAISVLTLVCGVCSVGAATPSDTTASGSAVTVKNKHKDGERQKGDMAKVKAVTSDTITWIYMRLSHTDLVSARSRSSWMTCP